MNVPVETVLIVASDCAWCDRLASLVGGYGYAVETVLAPEAAIEAAASGRFSGAIVSLGGTAGTTALPGLRELDPDLAVLAVVPPGLSGSSLPRGVIVVDGTAGDGQVVETLIRAFEHRRQVLENRRLVRELQAVREIARAVSRSRDIDEILDTTLRCVCDVLAAPAAGVRLRDEVTGRLRLRAAVGIDLAEETDVTPGGAGRWPGEAGMSLRHAVVIDDLQAEGWTWRTRDGRDLRAALAVPLVVDGELSGSLTVLYDRAGHFVRVDARLLTIVGHQLGLAVQDARDYAHVRQAKVEWERTVDAIDDPIAVLGADGRVVRANAALASHLGRAMTDLTGVPCDSSGLCDTAWPDCVVGQAVRFRRPTRSEVELGDGRILAVTTVPIEASEGRISVVQMAKDVTGDRRREGEVRAMRDELAVTNSELTAALNQLRSAQAQLIQAEKLAAIGQLVAGVAHELNNPLTSVLGYAHLIQDDLRGPEIEAGQLAGVTRDLQRIVDESERAARIVRNLLAFARRQTADRHFHQIPDLINQVLSLRAYEQRISNIEVVLDYAPELPPVWVDANEVQQALLNLILNAEQAMSGHRGRGELSIAAGFDAASSSVVVRIRDDGHGIHPENLARIFDPFFTTKPVGQGTGLGLSICYGIVRAHGGHIRAESEPGVSTTFVIELPARASAESGPVPRILIAHPDQAVRDFVAAALAGWGWEADSVPTARAAFDSLARSSANVVLADTQLLLSEATAWRAVLPRPGSDGPALVTVSDAGVEEGGSAWPRGVAAGRVSPPFELAALRTAVRNGLSAVDFH